MKPYLCLVLITLSFAPQPRQSRLIAPPFVRTWTQLIGEDTEVIAVQNRVIYYRSHNGVGALDLVTGQRRWSCLANQWIGAAEIEGPTIYALVREEKSCVLTAISCKSGSWQKLGRID